MSDVKHPAPVGCGPDACQAHALECDRITACCRPTGTGWSPRPLTVGAGDLGIITERLAAAKAAFLRGDYWVAVVAVRDAVVEALKAWQPVPAFSAAVDAAPSGGMLGDLLSMLLPLLLRLLKP